MQTRLAVTLTAALLISIGCTSPQPSQPPQTSSPAGAASAACRTAAGVVASLDEFFGSFNRGDMARVSSLLSTEFYAYSIPLPEGHFTSWSSVDAVNHLRARYLAGDRFEFHGSQVNELQGWDGAAHFGPLNVVLTRDGSAIPLTGKGALFCGGQFKGLKVLGLALAPPRR